MDDLLSDFIAETREMLASSESELVAWEANPTDRTRLDAIFRFVHTVKGNCGFFDLPRLAKLSHAAETALADVRGDRRQPDATLVTAVLAIIDRIMALVDALENGIDLPEFGEDELIAALEPGAEAIAPSPAPTASLSQEERVQPYRSIRLPVELLDRAMSGVSDMVLARNELARQLQQTSTADDLHAPFERLTGILSDVRDAIAKMRMNHIDHLYQSVPRMVRDLSAELGKQVLVDFEGGEVELDREVMEMLRDPISHIVRNAIDHGIEAPAQRIASGKAQIGSLRFTARHSGNQIILTIEDDGRGLDEERLVAKAIASGSLSPTAAAELSHAQKQALIFEAGLSTAEDVTAISGRGVGMDVVRANIEHLGGSIRVSSERGQSTRFELIVPLTLSILPGLTVSASDRHFAVPQANIEHIVRTASADIALMRMGGTQVVALGASRMPYLSLTAVLGLAEETDDLPAIVLVLKAGRSRHYALGIDRIVEYEDLVVQALPPHVMEAGLYAGCTMLGDGQPMLIVDPREIAERRGLFDEEGSVEGLHQDADTARSARKAMIFGDLQGRRCALAMEAVERVELLSPDQIAQAQETGFAVVDGQMLPVTGLGDAAVSGVALPALWLSGEAPVLLVTSGIEDTVDLPEEVTPCPGDSGIAGLFLSGDEPIRLLDVETFRERSPGAQSGEPEMSVTPARRSGVAG